MNGSAGGQHLELDRHDSVAVVRLNRPASRNALTHPMLRDLVAMLARLEAEKATRAIVLTGTDPAFCAGADLGGEPSDAEQTVRLLYNPMITAMTRMATPLVAGINGIAAGAGCSLALACDLRIAAVPASFQLSFTKIGLVPDAGATWLLPRAVGSTRAAEMALLGRRIGAEEALRWNLVNEVVPSPSLVERSIEVGHEIAALASSAGATKRLLLEGSHRDLETHLDAEATAQGSAQHSADFVRIRAAFRAKRRPQGA